jgi:hypothetical protein
MLAGRIRLMSSWMETELREAGRSAAVLPEARDEADEPIVQDEKTRAEQSRAMVESA